MNVNWWGEHIEAYQFFYNHALALLHTMDKDDSQRPHLVAHTQRCREALRLWEDAEDKYIAKKEVE